MSKIFRTNLFIFTLVIFVLSACNLPSSSPATEDPNVIFTQAALTVEAQLNQVAFDTPTLPPPQPTNTPLAFPTATIGVVATLPSPSTATQVCDQATFIKDVTIPDGTIFTPNQAFTKTWRLKNTGTCTWSGYTLVFDSGDAMSGISPIAIGTVSPGQEADLSADLKAPATNGSYRGYWRIRNATGVLLPVLNGNQGKSFFVDIKVDDGTSGGPFSVTGVTMSVSGSCGNFTITANVNANGAGSVTYKWIRSDGATDTNTHDPIVFTAAGTQSVSTTWAVSANGSFWMDIYIDAPNHQQFGRASFSCP